MGVTDFLRSVDETIVFEVIKDLKLKWRESSIMITSLNNLDYLLKIQRRGQEINIKFAENEKT